MQRLAVYKHAVEIEKYRCWPTGHAGKLARDGAKCKVQSE
jgi:hypothetical protein